MIDIDYKFRTTKLWEQLFKVPSLDSFLDENEKEVDLPAFHVFISALCEQRGEVPERVVRRADIERSYGHSLFRGARRPSRDTVLQLAFGFQADLELAQSLLKHAGHSPLYPRVRRDVVVSFCLIHQMSFVQAQDLLSKKELPLIGGVPK
jgi:hypothetical protein